jgi:hypothetical protein
MIHDTLIWHYTARLTTHLGRILDSGILLLDEIHPLVESIGFSPCVWFSHDQHYEAIASKLPWIKGRPSADGIAIAARIGVDAAEAPITSQSWYQNATGKALFRRQREEIADTFRRMTAVARNAGADLTRWRASQSVVRRCRWRAVEVYINNSWVPYDPHDPAHSLRDSVPLPDGSEAKLSTLRVASNARPKHRRGNCDTFAVRATPR